MIDDIWLRIKDGRLEIHQLSPNNLQLIDL